MLETMRDHFEYYKNYYTDAIRKAVAHAQEDCEDCRNDETVLQMYLDDVEHTGLMFMGMLQLARSCNIISIPEYSKHYDEMLAYAHDAYKAIEDIANS